MKILLIEPFFTGSHKTWALGLQKYSRHSIEILKMNGHYWKWRMHGGAITLARKFLKLEAEYDLILCSDMLDVTTFQSLTRSSTSNIPFALYFHENQLMYPWSPIDRDVKYKRDHHYAFINYSSALCVDHCFFNSSFHLNGFLDELKRFLKGFPDHNELSTVDEIQKKSSLLPLGLDLQKYARYKEKKLPGTPPIILWNHRWEHDKNPEAFFEILYQLKEKGIPFNVVVLGENFKKAPEVFEKAKSELEDRIIHWGYAETFEEYAKWLWKSDLLLVTSIQDFFGGSIIEAIYCHTYPLVPNRLAYPDHVPDHLKSRHIYNDAEDLISKTEETLENINNFKPIDMRKHVSRYDWTQLISSYDTAFMELKKAT